MVDKHNPPKGRTEPAALPDWSKLSRHDHVQVRSARGTVISGTIDMIAANRSVFWLIRNVGTGRTMVCYGDAVSVTKVPQVLTAHAS